MSWKDKKKPKKSKEKPPKEEEPKEEKPEAEKPPEEEVTEEKPVEEEKPPEKKPPKEEKVPEEKPIKKKELGRIGKVYEYDFEKGTIQLKNKKCSRCGNIMGNHKSPMNRWTCGSCSYTEFIKIEEK